ncbi:MAG: AAA family ATPase [Candidatus Micrarchaeota archaeon]
MIIGLTGTFGAGKGEVSKILMNHGYVYHSCSDVLRTELRQRGQEETIGNLAKLGNEIREKFGAGELPRRLVQIIRKRSEPKSIIDSIRNVGEVEELRKEKDFVLLSIEAPIETRHQRVKRRGRHGDDLSFDDFKNLEEAQMNGEGFRQNLKKCMNMADYKIANVGTLDELRENLEGVLGEIEAGVQPKV